MAGEQPTPPFRQASRTGAGLAPVSKLHYLKAGCELQNAKTLLQAICLLVNSIRRIKRFFYAQRKTMRTHETTVGENSASVTCHYEFDDEGDLDVMQIMFNGVDIVDALTLQQWAELEDECREAAKADYEEQKWDTKIDNLIELMNAETERLTR